jgi:maltoporin
LYALGGRGATDFSAGDNFGTVQGFEGAYLANIQGRFGPGYLPAPGTTISAGRAIDKRLTVKAGGQFIWNVASNFSLGVWAFWNLDDQGFGGAAFIDNGTVFARTSGRRNQVQGGIRPIFWLSDNIAIQGQAYGSYQDNTRVVGADVDGRNAFGRQGEMGVFTIAPTLKPKGGYFSRPELRVFATWAIWSNSLKGATSPIQEAGNAPFAPPYNGNTNQGWLFGTQVE